jgi:hypothetical protein
MIIDAEQQLLRDFMGSNGGWPTRPSARGSILDLEALCLFDGKGGRWRVIQDVLDEPPECPACHAPPHQGYYALKEDGGYEIRVCGSCLHDMANFSQQRLIRRYWRKVGQHLRAVSDWRDLMVAALVWLDLNRTYENTPGEAREQWVAVRRLYRRYIQFGFLGPDNANYLHSVVTGSLHAGATGDLQEIEAFRKKELYSTPEQRYLAMLLSPDCYRQLSSRGKRRVGIIWDSTKGDPSRMGPRTRVALTRLYKQTIQRRRGEGGIENLPW